MAIDFRGGVRECTEGNEMIPQAGSIQAQGRVAVQLA